MQTYARTVFVWLGLIVFSFVATAQNLEKKYSDKPNKIFNFQFHFTYQLPGGDLSSRFGPMYAPGGGILFKTKNNWVFSADGCYQFGYDFKDGTLLANLTNSSGVISNTGGYQAEFSLGMRGLQLFGKAGKVFSFSKYNKNSGVIIMAGAGFYSHKINIATLRNDIPTLTPNLIIGYDHLSMGPAITQTIGYYFHSPNRFINFYAGFDMVQAFTKNVRGFNYHNRTFDNVQRLDLTYGFRFAWMIPIYMQTKDEDEFFYR